MAKQQVLSPSQHNIILATLGFAALIAALLAIAWMINVRSAQPVLSPATPVSAPAASSANVGLSNRYFADELAGAHAQPVDAAVLTDPLPERLQDLSRPAEVVVVPAAPAANTGLSNRYFADELAGAHAQPVDAAVLTDPLPERLQDLSRPVIAVDGSGAPGSNLRISNRFFADEILSSTVNTTWIVPETTVVQPLAGPR